MVLWRAQVQDSFNMTCIVLTTSAPALTTYHEAQQEFHNRLIDWKCGGAKEVAHQRLREYLPAGHADHSTEFQEVRRDIQRLSALLQQHVPSHSTAPAGIIEKPN